MSFIDATALICGSSLARFSVMPCSPFIMSLRLVCSCRLFSMPMCRHCLRVSVSCALRGIRTQEMANVNNNLFISFFHLSAAKIGSLRYVAVTISSYRMFIFSVSTSDHQKHHGKQPLSWQILDFQTWNLRIFIYYDGILVSYYHGPFIIK